MRRQKAAADDHEDEEERAKGRGKKRVSQKYACHKCSKSYTGHTTWIRHLVIMHKVKDAKDTPASPRTQEKYRAYDCSKAKRAEADAKRKEKAEKKKQQAKKMEGESSTSEENSDNPQSDISDDDKSDVEKSDVGTAPEAVVAEASSSASETTRAVRSLVTTKDLVAALKAGEEA